VPDETSPFDQTLLYPTFDDCDFTSNLDWIFDQDSIDGSFTGMYPNTLMEAFSLQPDQGHLMSDLTGTEATARSTTTGSGDSAYASNLGIDLHVDSMEGMINPKPRRTDGPNGPWPSDIPTPPQHEVCIPHLGALDTDHQIFRSFYPGNKIIPRTRDALMRCVSLPFKNSPYQILRLDNFPSEQKLERCIDLYFAHFHQSAPIIHQPTFDPAKDLMVTLAMICIGSGYSDFEQATRFAVCLSELTARLLSFMAQADRRFVRTPSYLIAQVLQSIHGYGCGNERLFELSEAARGSLVHNAKCMGLFRHEQPEADVDPGSLESSWCAWIDAEQLRRLGWEVYKHDGSVTYLHNSRPFLSTGDIHLRLPASEEQWAAESAQAWSSLRPWSQSGFERVPRLKTVIRTLFDGSSSPLSKMRDNEHSSLVVLTLLRMLWSLKEIRSSPINDLTTPSSFEDGGQSLLAALRTMAVPVDPTTKTRLEHAQDVHRMLLIHTAHIFGAGDLMNWLYPYLRHGQEAENATRRMNQWAAEDPKRLREVAYHCSKLLGLFRLYPNNLPSESFMLFHAGVVLSCAALLLPQHDNSLSVPSVQLDTIENGKSDESELQKLWVTTGNRACPSLVGVPILNCDAGRTAVLEQTAILLKRCKVWGMAQKMIKVVLSMKTRASNSDHSVSIETASALVVGDS
jgi:hypothetical protein